MINTEATSPGAGDRAATWWAAPGTTSWIGGAGNDTLDGGEGSDTLVGNGGNDSYDFNGNYGPDVIINGVPANTTPSGQLRLGAGLDTTSPIILSPGNLWFASSGNDLVIQVLGTTNRWTVCRAGSPTLQPASITGVLPDGSQIGTAAITALASAMATYQSNNPTFDAQTASAMPNDATLGAALGADWARTITVSNGTVALGNNGTVTINGSADTAITGGAGDSATVVGNTSTKVTLMTGTGGGGEPDRHRGDGQRLDRHGDVGHQPHCDDQRLG